MSRLLPSEPPDQVVSFQYEDHILTHPLTACWPVPTALDPNGVYHVNYCETPNRPVLQKYNFIVLANRHMKVTISPDVGGRVTSLVHKGSGKEALYVPTLLRRWSLNLQCVFCPISYLFLFVVKELANRLFVLGRARNLEERSGATR